MVVMEVPKSFIGGIIGPGGKIIQGMQAETGTTITIEEIGNIGRVEISGTNAEGIAWLSSASMKSALFPLWTPFTTAS